MYGALRIFAAADPASQRNELRTPSRSLKGANYVLYPPRKSLAAATLADIYISSRYRRPLHSLTVTRTRHNSPSPCLPTFPPLPRDHGRSPNYLLTRPDLGNDT